MIDYKYYYFVFNAYSMYFKQRKIHKAGLECLNLIVKHLDKD